MERLIFHIDVNSAFLSWESARRVKQGLQDLRDIPACIGGDPKKRTGIVVAKSIPARKYGIQTGEPMAMAIRKCPELVIVKSDFELYIKCSRAFKEICASYAPVMESFSIDEVFLDMTGTSLIYPDPIQTAHEIKDKIKNELGFTVNVGISTNKLLAKMASDFEKPDKVHTLFPNEIPVKMWPLPVRDLLFLGKASEKKLTESWKGEPLRLIGVALTNLTDESFEQLSLFEDNEKKERNRKLDATMDAIRQKFGNDKITRASIMNSNSGIARKARAQMKNEDEKPE